MNSPIINYLHAPFEPGIRLPRKLPPLPVIAALNRNGSLLTVPVSLGLVSLIVILR